MFTTCNPPWLADLTGQIVSKRNKFMQDTTPEELATINKADIERAGRLVKAAGIQPE